MLIANYSTIYWRQNMIIKLNMHIHPLMIATTLFQNIEVFAISHFIGRYKDATL